MSIADLGTLKFRRALVDSVRDVVPVALDMFELGREGDIPKACDGHSLTGLLELALVDYRNRYTDTRREQLLRRDVEPLRGREPMTRALVCLFCATTLAIRATTRQSYRIAQLMINEPNDEDRVLDRSFQVVVSLPDRPAGDPAVWCTGDVRDAIRPHVVTCALTSLGCLQVPQRPSITRKATDNLALFHWADRA